MKKQFVYWLVFGLLMTIGCKKEESFETGNNPSVGSLQADASGDCLPKTVNGTYIANQALVPATNTITVQVNVNVVGNYIVYTDTVNGYYFRASGTFTSLGAQNVILRGNGTPFSANVNNFVVNYDSTQCDIQVTVLPAGTGSAQFTLAGAGGTCTGAVVAGTYAVGVPLASSNTVAITTNVTQIGTYTISTTYQGMTFTANGAFTATGPNVVVLVGTNTPTTAGANTVPLTAGTSTCSFVVNVSAPANATLLGAPGACSPINVIGTYVIGTAVSQTANTATVTLNVISAGAYAITTDTVGGVYFNTSGANIAVGNQSVTLAAYGTPTGPSGNKLFTVKYGTSTCTFTVNFQAGTGGACVCTVQGAGGACAPFTVNGAYYFGTALSGSNTVQVQIDVTTPGTWSFNTGAAVAGITFAGSGNVGLGLQTITLTGSGTPSATGYHTFTFSNGAGSTCTFVVNVLSTDYFPRVVGNNWSYEQDDDPTDSLYRYVIAGTHTAIGNSYNYFLSRDGTPPEPDSSGYYRRNGTDYFEWFDAGDYIGYTQPVWAEYTFLKDIAAGTPEWYSQGFAGTTIGPPPQNLNIRFKYKVDSRPATLTFNTSINPTGITFNDVIVVLEKFEAETAPGVWTDITAQVGYFKSYYAKGIGFIKFEQFDGSNVLQTQLELRRYRVY